MVNIPRGSFIFIILFIVLTLPFFLALLPQDLNTTEFSIYNTDWNGLSEFKDLIGTVDSTAKVETLIGSANALNRLNSSGGADSGALFILGPKVNYDPTEAIAILLYFLKGGRVVIADDFGTANDILGYFSLILQAIASADVDPLGLGTGLGGGMQQVDLDLPPLFDPLLPYLQPNTPSGRALWSLARPEFGIASLAQSSLDPTELASAGFDIIKSIVAVAINQSVLIDTQNFINSPVQPVLHAPKSDTATGQVVAPWVDDLTQGTDSGVVANYAAVLSMKVKYPTNFTNRNDPTDVIDYDKWFEYGLPPPLGQGGNRSEYVASHFETLWVPFGQFDLQIPSISALGSLADAIKPRFNLAALVSSEKSWIEYNVSQAKDVSRISPSAEEWGNIEFPVASMLPLGFDAAAPQMYLISDPSIFINKYVGTEITGTDNSDPNYFDPNGFSNRQFAINLLTQILKDRPNSIIYFDEGHLAQSYISPILYLGLFFRFLDAMTMFPLIAPLVPITVIGLARKYAPKGRAAAAPLLMTRIEQYSNRSYFAFKMRWFLEFHNYAKGLDLIYRRVRREIMKRYNLTRFSPELAEQAMMTEFPQVAKKKLAGRLMEIERIVASDALISEEEFMKHYLILKEISTMMKR